MTIKPDESGVQVMEEGTSSRAGGGGGGGGSGGGRRATNEHPNLEIISDDEADGDRQRLDTIINLSSDQDDFDDDSEIQDDTDDEKPRDSRRKGKQNEGIKADKSKLELRPVMSRTNPDPEAKKKAKAEKKSRDGAIKKVESVVQDLDADVTAGDAMDIDEPVPVKEQPSSPEMKRRGLKKPGGRAREAKFANETIEERAERLRMMHDAQRLRRVFKQVRVKSEEPAVGVAAAVREDSKQTDQSDDAGIDDTRDPKGELFLFQLPPLTPFLVDSASVDEEPEVKKEPGTDGVATATTATNPTTGGDETKKANTDDGVSPTKPELQIEGTLTATEPTRLPAGLVGKLRLHKSGKVSLDWGGADMEVRYGSTVDFLQDVVMVETRRKNNNTNSSSSSGVGHVDGEADGNSSGGAAAGDGPAAGNTLDEVKQETDDGLDGTAYTLGHVRQKMVCIPDWAKLFD